MWQDRGPGNPGVFIWFTADVCGTGASGHRSAVDSPQRPRLGVQRRCRAVVGESCSDRARHCAWPFFCCAASILPSGRDRNVPPEWGTRRDGTSVPKTGDTNGYSRQAVVPTKSVSFVVICCRSSRAEQVTRPNDDLRSAHHSRENEAHSRRLAAVNNEQEGPWRRAEQGHE